MNGQTQPEISEAPALRGDARRFLAQLGTAAELVSLDTAVHLPEVRSLPELRNFLQSYETRMLLPLEWPAILRAYGHASRNELRELLALDAELGRAKALRDFAAASCRVGQRQLSRLRPLRDQRLVQRYLKAVETGQARGWHTLVYGISLQVFSLPLRQGLLHYARQTGRGFILSAARQLRLGGGRCHELLDERSAGWPQALNHLLQPNGKLQLLPA